MEETSIFPTVDDFFFNWYINFTIQKNFDLFFLYFSGFFNSGFEIREKTDIPIETVEGTASKGVFSQQEIRGYLLINSIQITSISQQTTPICNSLLACSAVVWNEICE